MRFELSSVENTSFELTDTERCGLWGSYDRDVERLGGMAISPPMDDGAKLLMGLIGVKESLILRDDGMGCGADIGGSDVAGSDVAGSDVAAGGAWGYTGLLGLGGTPCGNSGGWAT